jgi:predicted metalloprotease
MRLDDFDPGDIDIEDQRGRSFPVGMRGGSIGCGTLIIALIASLVFGVDPTQLIGGLQDVQQQNVPEAQTQGGSSAQESCTVDAASRESCNALASLNKTWEPLFRQANIEFRRPKLVFYSQQGSSGCGAAQSAMGPFYCPTSREIYLDTAFFRDLERRFRGCSGKACEFAQAYVIAHEVGHHIQNLLGILPKVQQAQRASTSKVEQNRMQVRVELQADCFAGVWANKAEQKWKLLQPGDIDAALQTASAIGDDMLQKRAQGYAVPDSFTHGSSEQRKRWFMTGFRQGTVKACNTFSATAQL